jgi:hypothetical protein
MSETTYSLVFDRQSAADSFKQIGKRELMLAVLARIVPNPAWEGCTVYEGETPLEEVRTVCVGTRGAAADKVQERLVETLEGLGIRVLEVYEGGPEERERLAQVRDGRWASD